MSTGTGCGQRYHFDEADESVATMDAALRAAATDAPTVDECAAVVADDLGDDYGRLRIRAFQLGLYEPEWPSHIDRGDVERAAAECETLREVAERLRISRKMAKRTLRWAGAANEVKRTTMLSVLRKVRNGELDTEGAI